MHTSQQKKRQGVGIQELNRKRHHVYRKIVRSRGPITMGRVGGRIRVAIRAYLAGKESPHPKKKVTTHTHKKEKTQPHLTIRIDLDFDQSEVRAQRREGCRGTRSILPTSLSFPISSSPNSAPLKSGYACQSAYRVG